MRTQPQSHFLKSLPIVAGCLGNKLGVKVVLGDVACTDGETIMLPMFIDENVVSREELLGYMVHEAGHIRYTDMTGKYRSGVSPLEAAFINTLEDARIEKLIGLEYAGAPYLLECAHKNSTTKFLDPSYVPNPEFAMPVYTLLKCEATYNESVKATLDVFQSWFDRYFGRRLRDKFDLELAKFSTFESTADVAQSAKRLMQLVMEEFKHSSLPQPKGQQAQEGQGSDQDFGQGADSQDNGQEGGGNDQSASGNNDQSQGQSSKSGDPQDGSDQNAQGQGQSQGQSSDGSDSEGDGQESGQTQSQGKSSGQKGQGNAQNQPSSDGDSCDSLQGAFAGGKSCNQGLSQGNAAQDPKRLSEILEALKQAIEAGEIDVEDLSKDIAAKLNSDQNRNSDKRPTKETGTEITVPSDFHANLKVPELVEDVEITDTRRHIFYGEGQRLLSRAKRDSVSARRALTGLIQAKTSCGIYTANSGRSIQTSRLANLSMGNARVFERREQAVSADTCVSILLDCSASMEEAHGVHIRASLALLAALGSIPRVKAALSVFPGYAICDGLSLKNRSYGQEDCVKVVPFGENPTKRLISIGRIESRSATPLAESLVQCGFELAARREKRKILIVITDGDVTEFDKSILKLLKDSGIVLVGLGVGHVNQNFFNGLGIKAVIKGFSALPSTLMDLSKQVLLAGIE